MKKLLSLLFGLMLLAPSLALAQTPSPTSTPPGGRHYMRPYMGGHNQTGTGTPPSLSGLFSKIIHATSTALSIHSVSGTVVSVTGTSIALTGSNGNAYTVDASTAKIVRKYGATMAITDIQNGDSLQISGTVSGASVTAKTIRDNSQQQVNASFSGSVTGVSASSFTLQTKNRGVQTINTDSSTKFKESGQTSVSIANVLTGENVETSGVWDSTASTVAASIVTIVVKTGTVTGTLTNINGTTLTVTTSSTSPTVYTVDASNVKRVDRRYGASTDLAALQAGDTLQVRGTINVDNITATSVRDMSLQARNGTFVGTVSALGGDGMSFTLQSKDRGNQTINTGTSTVFRVGTAAGSYASLAVGQTATVSGVWDRTNTNVTANRVTIKVSSLTFTGTLSAISGTTLTVVNASSTSYSVDATKARVIFEHGHSGSLANFQVNDQVKVWGSGISGSLSLTAREVQDLSRAYNSTSTPVSTTAPQ